MAQTKYCGYFVSPTGHRFVMMTGTHAFGNTAKVTLTVQLKRVVAAFFNPAETAGAATKSTAMVGSYIPYMSVSQLTIAGLATPYRAVVDRKYKNSTSLKFSYTLVGW